MVGSSDKSDEEINNIVRKICERSNMINGSLFLRKDLEGCEKKLKELYTKSLEKHK